MSAHQQPCASTSTSGQHVKTTITVKTEKCENTMTAPLPANVYPSQPSSIHSIQSSSSGSTRFRQPNGSSNMSSASPNDAELLVTHPDDELALAGAVAENDRRRRRPPASNSRELPPPGKPLRISRENVEKFGNLIGLSEKLVKLPEDVEEFDRLIKEMKKKLDKVDEVERKSTESDLKMAEVKEELVEMRRILENAQRQNEQRNKEIEEAADKRIRDEMRGVNVRIDQQNKVIIHLQGDNSRLQQQVENLKFELASKKDQEAELKTVREELEALKGRIDMLFASQPAQPTHQPQSSPAPSTSTAATERLNPIPESGMTESSENAAPVQTQTAPPPSQGPQECARARPFDRENCSIKTRPQKANGAAPNEQEAAPKLGNAADKKVVEKKKKKKRTQFRPTPPESSNESESDTDSDYVLPSPKSPEKVRQRRKSREVSPRKISSIPESSKQPKVAPTPEKPAESSIEKDEATKGGLTLAKKRLSDDMDISSGSDDSDPDRTTSFAKDRSSTDQHNEAVTENACQSVYNGPILQSPMSQEKCHPPVFPRIPKKAPTAGVSQVNDESRASSSSMDSEKRQKPVERTESANPISTPVLNDPIPISSNEASKDSCAKPKEVPPPIPRPPIGKIPLLPPVRPTIKPAAAVPQPVPPPWGNLWRPIQPPRPTETASARGILDQILESQTSQSFFSPPETIESRRMMLKRLASNETDPDSSPDSVTAAKRWRHEDSSTDDPQMGNQSPATVPSTTMVPPSSNFLGPFPQPGLIDESVFLTAQQKEYAKWGKEIEALLPPEKEEPLPTKREDLIRLKDELENEIPKYGRKLLQFQHRLEHFKGICFFCKASCVHPSNLCPVIKRLDVRRKFLDSHPDFCRLCLRMKVNCKRRCTHPCRFCQTASPEKTGACNGYTNPRSHNSALCPLPFERQKKEVLLQRVKTKLWEMNSPQPDAAAAAAASTSLNNSQLAFLQPFNK